MKYRLATLLITISTISSSYSQVFIPLWPDKQMPNSKGITLKDSIANERIYQVGCPGITVWQPSSTENKRMAVLIIPGGGYVRLSHVISGSQIAKWFNTIGITAFVLQHRLPQSPDLIDKTIAPLQDAQRAMKLIRANALSWNLDIDKIGVMGFSAGGHLASSLGTHPEDYSSINDTTNNQSFAPNFMILVSPVISMTDIGHKGSRINLLGENASEQQIKEWSNETRVTAQTPPTLLILANNDKSVSPLNSILFYEALLKNNVSASLHIFPEGGHNIALRNNPGSCNMWTSICEQWLEELKK